VVSTAVPTGNAYDKYASSNPVERRLMAGFLAQLDSLLPSEAPGRALEVGVGEGEIAGRISARWPDASIAGLDLPDAGLREEWRRRELAGTFGDVAALPFATATFGLVLAIEVLEHVPDPTAALREIERVAVPGAAVILSVPHEPLWRVANMARGKYWGALGNTPGHIQHWSRRSFAALVGRRFEQLEVRSPAPWTMVAARTRR
jgi:ubiquinone/menaquinone biosynthesis C-methylase UbiE